MRLAASPPRCPFVWPRWPAPAAERTHSGCAGVGTGAEKEKRAREEEESYFPRRLLLVHTHTHTHTHTHARTHIRRLRAFFPTGEPARAQAANVAAPLWTRGLWGTEPGRGPQLCRPRLCRQPGRGLCLLNGAAAAASFFSCACALRARSACERKEGETSAERNERNEDRQDKRERDVGGRVRLLELRSVRL